MTTTNPTLLKMPLARDGDKTAIPETTGSTTGDFSQQYGFQEINQLPLGAGGVAPKRDDFNGVFNLLSGLDFFAQKGWTFHYDNTQDYYLGCVIIDPADGNRYECIADMPAGTVAPHEDTDGDYWRRFTLGDGIAVGIILPFAGNGAIPSGYLLCDGAAYSRTAFPDLFAAIGTDYGSGDGSTTFNVPDSNQAKRFLQGDTVAGQTKEAGLPNITGSASSLAGARGNTYSGAITTAWVSNNNLNFASGAEGFKTMTFDASRSNPIYGNSTTVQPDALTTRYIIKAFDGQTADSALIDITQYENELGNKADRSLSNLTDAGKSFSFPSDTYVDISSYVNSGTNYIAPADGYIYLGGRNASGNNAYVLIYNNSTILEFSDQRSAANAYPNAFVPAKKGQSFTLSISSDASGDRIARFFYASGEVPA